MKNRMQSFAFPALVGVAVTLASWVTMGAIRSEYAGLDHEDETRIVAELRRYVDTQVLIIRDDLGRLHDMQLKILIELQTHQPSRQPKAANPESCRNS